MWPESQSFGRAFVPSVTHMDNSHAKGGYPTNFGPLSALTHHTISLQMGLYPDLHVQKKRGKMTLVCKRA